MTSRIALTVGDPSGVGPEIAVKALARWDQRNRVVLIGEERSLENAIAAYAPQLDVEIRPVTGLEPAPLGKVTAAGGAAAMAALDAGIDLLLEGEAGAIVTGPIHKGAVRAAGFEEFEGHTEYLAERLGVTEGVSMLLESSRLSVAHVSTHRSLRAATELDPGRIDRVIDLASEYLLGVSESPTILVAGLNPHASEDGAFGDDEAETITPAIERARARHPTVRFRGPIAADSIFLMALDQPDTVVIAMYHDQGHIPVKLIARDTAINTTLGLPFVRTSVDHGTAHDIARLGTATVLPMTAALDAAVRLWKQ